MFAGASWFCQDSFREVERWVDGRLSPLALDEMNTEMNHAQSEFTSFACGLVLASSGVRIAPLSKRLGFGWPSLGNFRHVAEIRFPVVCPRRHAHESLARVSPAAWHASEISAPGGCLVSAPRTSNHRVEVNRHQPRCLPGRLGYLMIPVHSRVRGQVAVTHSGR